jgi:hypothetical protein
MGEGYLQRTDEQTEKDDIYPIIPALLLASEEKNHHREEIEAQIYRITYR